MPERSIISLVKEITADGASKDWNILGAIQFHEPYPVRIVSLDMAMSQTGYNIGGSAYLYVERHDIGGSDLRFREDRRLVTMGPGVWAAAQNYYPSSSVLLTCNVYCPNHHVDVDLSVQSNDVLLVAGGVNLTSAPAAGLVMRVSCLVQYVIVNPYMRYAR